ncbi:MAG TPA: amino acid permease [Gemmatimonadaceae bacterium]|nr:amino acid permease [Gemmatimonadaceae bacterium]
MPTPRETSAVISDSNEHAGAPTGARGFVAALTLTDAAMLVAGSMIGSGIFIVSADMARSLTSPFWLLMAWVLTGLITLAGALSIAELAAMFPRAGGQYVFLKEAMGPVMGFLFGWTLFVVIQTGTIAAVAVAFGRFLGVLWPAIGPERFSWFPQADLCLATLGCKEPGNAIQLGLSPQRLIALLSLWLLTWINLRGVKQGKTVQTLFTAAKALGLAMLVVLGVLIGRNGEAIAANFSNGNFFGNVPVTSAFVLAFGAALVGSLFSSDAWLGVTFAASEVQNPRRNLPRALLIGTGLVTVLYVLCNVAYLLVLPIGGSADGVTVLARGISHATQDRVGVAAAEMIFGASAGTLMACLILVSTFGCNNGLILAGSRVFYAMAKDGLFFRSAGTLNTNGVPARAMLMQSAWTSLLCLSGTYGQLLDYVIFAALAFYALTTVGLFVLRRTRPDAERPYKAFAYPVLPALYILACVSVAVILLVADKTRAQAVSGLVLVLLGLPVYLLTRRGQQAAA